MVDAGLPLPQSLNILGANMESKSFSDILKKVKGSIESGATFSESLARHPKAFDELYVNLVAAGEAGGILDGILNRLGEYIEKAVKIKRQVKSAMMYPAVVLVVAFGVIAVMLGKVIPTFEKMYENFDGAQLPGPTQVVIKISHAFTNNAPLIFGIIFAVVFGIAMARRTPKGRVVFDKVLLRLPIVGGLLRKIAVARFTRTLGTLLNSGVAILDALEICAKTSGNKEIEAGIMYARDKVSQGNDVAGPLAETKVFPQMVTQMVGVGEETGALDQMLNKIADFYEEEVDVAVAGMTSMIEPLMMAFLGVVVGGLIIAMYLPIFEIAGNVG